MHLKLEVKDILLAFVSLIALVEVYYLYMEQDKIVVQVKKEIVYKDRYIETECPKLEKIAIPTKSIALHKLQEVENNTTVSKIYPEIKIKITKNKLYIVASTRDSGGRFSISLLSKSKPNNQINYEKKIIFEGEIIDDISDYKHKFSLFIPPSILENLDDLQLEILDAQTSKKYKEDTYQLSGLSNEFIYKMEVNVNDGFNYSIYELRTTPKIPKLSKDILDKIRM
jgi:hypothetical protein